jgi:hypothetical protein
MTAGEAMIGSWEFTLPEGGVTADEAAVGSCMRAPPKRPLQRGPSKEG